MKSKSYTQIISTTLLLLILIGCNPPPPTEETKSNKPAVNSTITINCRNPIKISLKQYIDSTHKITSLPPIANYHDRKPFQFFSQYNADFRTFLCIMCQADFSISNFEYDSTSKTIKIVADDDSSLTDKNFFYRTHDHETSFYYYRYYDIYKSLFRFKEIENIEIWVNGKNKTYLPLEGDTGFLLPGGTMKRKWLVSEEKYSEVFSGKDAFEFTNSSAGNLSLELRETFMDSVHNYVIGNIQWK